MSFYQKKNSADESLFSKNKAARHAKPVFLESSMENSPNYKSSINDTNKTNASLHYCANRFAWVMVKKTI